MSYRSGQDPEESLPDWLKDLRKRQSQESSHSDKTNKPHVPSEQPNKEEPSWLTAIRQRYSHSETKPEAARPDKPEDALSDTQPIPPNRTTKAHSESSEQADPSPEPSVKEPEIGETESPQPPKPEIPAWLEELDQPESPKGEEIEQISSQIPAFMEGTTEELAPGELPSWLQAMRPSGVFPQEDTRSSEMLPGAQEAAGPLAGLSGTLPAEPKAIQSIKPPVYSTRLDLTDSQSRHVTALEKLLNDEAKPSDDRRTPATLPARLLNTLMGVALILAVLFPVLNQGQLAPRPDLEALPESKAIFDLIEGLPSGAPVLIGFDLQPAFYGEAKAVIAAVLSHLLEKQAQLVFVSTQPTGPVIAENILHDELANQPAVTASDYTNLGYLSGGMAALRHFLNDPRGSTVSLTALGLNPWANPSLESINGISDFALVVIVSSGAEDARLWIEQGAAELPSGLIAVTSAQAAPLLRPYLQGNPQTLKGLVSGLRGAVVYEQLRSQENIDSRAQWDAYSFGLGAIVLLIFLGGLYERVIHLQPENRTKRSPHSPAEKETTGSQRAD